LITFGAPHIGSYDFAILVDRRLNQQANVRTGDFLPIYVRVVNYNDIVSHLPFVSWSYYHAGLEFWIIYENDNALLCHAYDNHKNDYCVHSLYPFLGLYCHSNFSKLMLGTMRSVDFHLPDSLVYK
jgi:hypothetical protein